MTKTGSNIKKIRTTKGLSQQAFADLFELTRGNISSYEENRAEPRIETLIKIANHFSIPVEKFITETLTVHEILKYNGDKVLDQENHIIHLQLKQVPFLNEAIFLKCMRGELNFSNREQFPQLTLPDAGASNLLAVTFNHNIPHHHQLPEFKMSDVLIFETVNEQNFHLCPGKFGLYITNSSIIIGQYVNTDKQLDLVLNDLRKHTFTIQSQFDFWRLFAIYQHQ